MTCTPQLLPCQSGSLRLREWTGQGLRLTQTSPDPQSVLGTRLATFCAGTLTPGRPGWKTVWVFLLGSGTPRWWRERWGNARSPFPHQHQTHTLSLRGTEHTPPMSTHRKQRHKYKVCTQQTLHGNEVYTDKAVKTFKTAYIPPSLTFIPSHQCICIKMIHFSQIFNHLQHFSCCQIIKHLYFEPQPGENAFNST